MTTIPIGSVTEICYVTRDLAGAVQRWAESLGAGPFLLVDYPGGLRHSHLSRQPGRGQLFRRARLLRNFTHRVRPTAGRAAIGISRGPGGARRPCSSPRLPQHPPARRRRVRRRTRPLRAGGFAAALNMVLPGLGRNVLFDARHKLGVFVELLEVSSSMYAGVERMLSAHQNWNGVRPLRDFMETME